jgi:hypothetical protein
MKLKNIYYTITHWETWHHHVKYIPLTPVWIWYCIRSGTPWFFTSSNPGLTFGGFEGEGKKEMYEQLPPGSFPHTIYITPGISFEEVKKQMEDAGFKYPFIVKPNVGMMGFMFRKITEPQQLKLYHETMPIEYLIQELVNYPIEVSAFYYKIPGQSKGHISGFLKKEPPYLIGDGISTIESLINGHEGIRLKKEEVLMKHSTKLKDVLAPGETYFLSYASNRNQGGKLTGIDHEIDENLQQLITGFSQYPQPFYYGRYDIKCNSVEDLKAGKNFSILEFNGAGAGTQHIYANGYSFWKACAIILFHWKMLFLISRKKRGTGIKDWGVLEGWRHLKAAKKNLMMLKKMNEKFPSF